MRLLIVEDADRLRDTLCRGLTRMGHAVEVAVDGLEGGLMARQADYDALVLDLNLPEKGGLEVLAELRAAGDATPVLILTALDDIEVKVRGLGLGADDYLTKPFAFAELVARLEALVRRRNGHANPLRRIGPLEIDMARKSVSRDGGEIALSAREFALLELLARRPGQVWPRERIEEQLYAEGDSPQSNAVDAAVYALRRKLCPPGAAPLIHTRRGLGYVLEVP